MAGTANYLKSRYKQFRRSSDIQLKAGTFFLLFLSLLFSLGDGLIYSFGWFSLGLMGLLLLYKKTPRYFFLVIWLGIVYFLIGLGSIVSFIFSNRTGNWFLMILGYSIIMSSFILLLYLILYIKERRDDIAKEGQYISIGIWSFIVLLFFISSFLSVIGWIKWSDDTLDNRLLYFLSEICVIVTFIYTISFPENRFPVAIIDTSPDRGLKSFISNIGGYSLRRDDKIRKMDIVVSCPICNDPLIKETRRCPTCDSKRSFYWCDRSEEFFVRCPNCLKLTPIGRQRCINCSVRISNKIRCSRCKNVNPINSWLK